MIESIIGLLIAGLLSVVGYFLKDLIDRTKKNETRLDGLEKLLETPFGIENKRLSIVETFNTKISHEVAGVILQISSVEQNLGTEIYKLRRAVASRGVENRGRRAQITQILESGKGIEGRIRFHEETLEKLRKISGSLHSRLERVEKIVMGETVIFKGKKE